MYLLGTDEAGYGPNLGPLLIAVSAWSIPDNLDPGKLDEHVASVIAREAPSRRKHDDRLVIADSKQLYNPARGLGLLERQFHLALRLTGQQPTTWRELWQGGLVIGEQPLDATPWHAEFDEPLPLESPAVEASLVTRILHELAECGVRLERLQARAVFPLEFNTLVDRHETKSHVLSDLTLELLCRTIHSLPPGAALAVCDKHGARNHYGPLLQPHVDAWIEVLRESAAESAYRWTESGRAVELRLQPRCEGHIPAALASMTAKYLRELAMRAFNRFWCDRVPGLKPTAGYPQDARRFADAIKSSQTELGIAPAVLWRKK
jgi:hypothetical protein